jgi:hypothetical protein
LNSILDPKTHLTGGIAERKNTMLWNTKISEARAVQIADCLSDKNSLKGTVRITKANKSTVKRLRREIGKQAKSVHNALVKNVKAKVVEFDERYGFAVSKDQPVWEATMPARCVLWSRRNSD